MCGSLEKCARCCCNPAKQSKMSQNCVLTNIFILLPVTYFDRLSFRNHGFYNNDVEIVFHFKTSLGYKHNA